MRYRIPNRVSSQWLPPRIDRQSQGVHATLRTGVKRGPAQPLLVAEGQGFRRVGSCRRAVCEETRDGEGHLRLWGVGQGRGPLCLPTGTPSWMPTWTNLSTLLAFMPENHTGVAGTWKRLLSYRLKQTPHWLPDIIREALGCRYQTDLACSSGVSVPEPSLVVLGDGPTACRLPAPRCSGRAWWATISPCCHRP